MKTTVGDRITNVFLAVFTVTTVVFFTSMIMLMVLAHAGVEWVEPIIDWLVKEHSL